jgi:hypothetical protein
MRVPRFSSQDEEREWFEEHAEEVDGVELDENPFAVQEMVVIEVDSRGRVSLGRLRQDDIQRYLGHVEPDGTVILQPAVALPASEEPG